MSRAIGCLVLALGIAVVATILVACVVVSIVANRSGDGPLSGRYATEWRSENFASPEELGEAIYLRQCRGCHAIDGQSWAGPTFRGLYGSEVSMEDGSVIRVDEDHLRLAITDPRATTRDGYRDIMPPFSGLSDEEIDALIAYIRSLQ